MVFLHIPTQHPGWGFFYCLPSLPSSRPPGDRCVDTRVHAQGAPGRRSWRPRLRGRSSWAIPTCTISTNWVGIVGCCAATSRGRASSPARPYRFEGCGVTSPARLAHPADRVAGAIMTDDEVKGG
jgi:hypothetical protein